MNARDVEPIVFLPGMMCDARLFAPQLARFSSDHVICVAPLGIADRMEDVAASTLADCPARFALAGLSMGGIVAMEMIRQQPDRVTRLALLNTNHLRDTDERRAIRARQIEDVRGGRLSRVMRDEMKPNYLGSYCDRDAILDLCMAMALDLGPDVFRLQSMALTRRRDQTDTLRRWRKPTLLLCGAEDSLCPPERHDAMADLIDDAERVTIDGAGHLTTLEAPDAVNDALGRWLGR